MQAIQDNIENLPFNQNFIRLKRSSYRINNNPDIKTQNRWNIEIKNVLGDQVYKANLLKARCISTKQNRQRCRRYSIYTLPWCFQHLKQNGLTVQRTTLRDENNRRINMLGLFACDNKRRGGPKTIVFRRGQYIVDYIGEDLTENQLNARYPDFYDPQKQDWVGTDAVYTLQRHTGRLRAGDPIDKTKIRYTDAARLRGVASLANSLSNDQLNQGHTYNAFFNLDNVTVGRGFAVLTAGKDIYDGEEIFVDYAPNAWQNDESEAFDIDDENVVATTNPKAAYKKINYKCKTRH